MSPCSTPLIAAMAANFINLSLDLILIFVFGLGVAGAAIATTISQVYSVLMHVTGILNALKSVMIPVALCALRLSDI